MLPLLNCYQRMRRVAAYKTSRGSIAHVRQAVPALKVNCNGGQAKQQQMSRMWNFPHREVGRRGHETCAVSAGMMGVGWSPNARRTLSCGAAARVKKEKDNGGILKGRADNRFESGFVNNDTDELLLGAWEWRNANLLYILRYWCTLRRSISSFEPMTMNLSFEN